MQNLSINEAIVDAKGYPTPFFMRLLQNRGVLQDEAEVRLDELEGIQILTTSPITGGGATLGDHADFTIAFIDVAASKLLGRGSAAGAGPPVEITVGTGLSLVATTLACTVVGLTDGDKGEITVADAGATWTIDNGVVTLAKQANVATATVFYRKTAGAGAPEVQTLATLKTDLGLTGTNSGDQTTIVGITGTVAEFNSALTGADFYTSGGTDVALADGGTGASLADPNADRIMFWDDSAGAVTWLEAGGGLSISGTTITASLTLASTVTQSGTPVPTSVGFLGAPQMADQDDYTLALTDSGGHYYHVSGTPHTLTIPANGSVAFPIGTVIAVVNESGGGALSIAITTDTLRWGSSTGTRTLAANGTATLLKVTATMWRLTGDGIT